MPQDDVPSRFSVDLAGVTLLGIYRVERKIADGGMGSVWLGEDTNLGRRVVVKVPHVRFLGEAGFRARFTREITELVRLEHPSIVRILAQGTHDEIPFFVLQYLGGGSLEDRLAAAGDGPRGVEAVVGWLRTIAATLDFVHGRGVVHRDVKPENILFDEEGHVFLSDFGVVKALDEDANVTEVGTGIGSPKYMAPEQGLGMPVGGAADQYGLATTVYEALAGRLPFTGDSALEILLNKQKDPPTDLGDLVPDLPPACVEAVMRGLARDPGDRFLACQDFADAFLAGAGIHDRTPAAGVPSAAGPAVAPRRFATVAMVVILAALLAVFLFRSHEGPTDAERGAFEVVLLSPGAEPRRVLRYRPAPGTEETMVTAIATVESKRLGEQEPVEVHLPGAAIRLRLALTDVARNGVVSFRWEAETTLDVPAGTPAPLADAMRQVARSLAGTSGAARQSAQGIHLDLRYDAPPPEAAEVQQLFALITEVVEQVATPLPEEPVGVGARWEVTTARDHIEGVRLTQTVTYELASLDDHGARLRMYIAVTALSQDFEHGEIPDGARARLKRVHGDGEGEVVIDFDRLVTRSSFVDVETRTELSVTDGDEERDLSVVRKMRIESKRE